MRVNKSDILFLLTKLILKADSDKDNEKIRNVLLATKAEIESNFPEDEHLSFVEFCLRLMRGML